MDWTWKNKQTKKNKEAKKQTNSSYDLQRSIQLS